MALSLQNLFAVEAEDFDDEDFLSVLEMPETCYAQPGPTGVHRLRPSSHRPHANPSLADDNPAISRSDQCPGLSTFSHDLDDDELLSACSELEGMESGGCRDLEGTGSGGCHGVKGTGPFACIKSTGSRLCLKPTTHNETGIPHRGAGNTHQLPAFQLRPSREGQATCWNSESTTITSRGTFNPKPGTLSRVEPNSVLKLRPSGGEHEHRPDLLTKRPCLQEVLESQHHVPQQDFSPRGLSRHCQSPQPMPKRTCLRAVSENCPQAVGATALQSGHGGQDISWKQVIPQANTQGVLPVPRSPFSSTRPSTPSSLQTPVTNHLVQLVTAANQTQRRLSWQTPCSKERKFPGPAGVLPQQGGALKEIMVSAPTTPTHGTRTKLCTKEVVSPQQPVGDGFVGGPWAAMKAELGLDERDPTCFLHSYSVVMVLRKAALKQLPRNKVPQMAVSLRALTRANGDASAAFRDPTGDIQGTVHHLLLEERESELKIGCVLLLKQVGVFSPSHRNHYLNVTPSNLVKIYNPGEGLEDRSPGQLPVSMETDLNSNHSVAPQLPPCSRALQGDWNMDDLDSLFCDLPEDPGL